MTSKKTFSVFVNEHQNKILTSLFITLGIISVVFTSLVGLVNIQNTPSKISQAASVYQCATGESLSGTNCLSTATTYPIYTEACESGYTAMDYVCVTFTQKVCTDYPEAVADTLDTTLCKIGDINRVQLSEITDNDGRRCNGNGYNFKYYNVGLTITANTGPIVCAGPFSTVSGKVDFRFIPRAITSVRNFLTTQTGTSTPVCPTGYTLSSSQCSIPAKVTNCSSAGEYLDTTSGICKPCAANKYCLNSTTGETTTSICPNGGTLSNNLCIATNKVATMTYVDGCTSTYQRFDKTCAIEEIRTHDLQCSYFYASDNVNVLAVQDPNLTINDFLRCSTGGRTDYNTTSITKVSDLECAGTGTGWYNYNVAYDPLVCGNTFDPNNKAAFRWSEKTFLKIVGLQKLGTASTICPAGWTPVANSDNCSQAPIVQRLAVINNCPSGSFSSEGSTQASNCTTTQTSTTLQSSISSTTNTSGGGVIIISNQSSSSSSSSVAKPECVLKSNEYLENSECKPCPAGTITTSSNPTTIRDCVTIVNVDKPTIRSGGLNELNSTLASITAVTIVLVLTVIKKHHQRFLQGWSKIS
jgi:hypothetical protein